MADLLRFRAEYYEVASAIGSRGYPQAQQQGFLDQGAESSEKWGEESPLAATKRGKRRGKLHEGSHMACRGRYTAREDGDDSGKSLARRMREG